MTDTAEQLAELSALTAGLAHEIRNPLSTLHVNLQLLDEDWRGVESPGHGSNSCDPQDVARRSRLRLATLLSETRRLERILADFLQYVGRRELDLAVQDVNVLVQELVDFFQAQAAAHRVVMQVQFDPSPLPCRVDVDAFKQAVLNLLINALEAMPDGGRLSIVTTVEPGDTSIGKSDAEAPAVARLDVCDSGFGVPAELNEKIFQACFSTKRGGTGLGLAAARRLIQAQGGRLSLAASREGGACFSVQLPMVHPSPQASGTPLPPSEAVLVDGMVIGD